MHHNVGNLINPIKPIKIKSQIQRNIQRSKTKTEIILSQDHFTLLSFSKNSTERFGCFSLQNNKKGLHCPWIKLGRRVTQLNG